MQRHRRRRRALLLEHERDRRGIVGSAGEGMRDDLRQLGDRRVREQRENVGPALGGAARIGSAIALVSGKPTPGRLFRRGNPDQVPSVRPDVLFDQRRGPDARHRPDEDRDRLGLLARDLGEGVFSAGVLQHAGVSAQRRLRLFHARRERARPSRIRGRCQPTRRQSFRRSVRRCSHVPMPIARISAGGFSNGSMTWAGFDAMQIRCRRKVQSRFTRRGFSAKVHLQL